MHKKEKGFTLIELLVVIAILGILAAVVVPNVSKFIGSGSDEAEKTEVKNVRLAVTALMADAGVSQLGGNYTDVNAVADVEAVVDSGDTHSLDEYLDVDSTLKCTYAISISGTVSQSSC